ARRFENHLVGGAARFWRRGGLPPTPAFPGGKRERGEIPQLISCGAGGRLTKGGIPSLGKRKASMALSSQKTVRSGSSSQASLVTDTPPSPSAMDALRGSASSFRRAW